MGSLIFNIARADLKDLEALKEIGKTTFVESFAEVNTKEDMDLYLRESFSDALLTKELQNQDIHFYLAYLGEKVVGYLKLNFGAEQKEMEENNSLEIERIYILKEFQNKSVGQLLFEKALEIAGLRKISCLWLGVWENNSSAIRFYQRNGFVEFDKHVFKLGNDLQTDILMKLEINL